MIPFSGYTNAVNGFPFPPYQGQLVNINQPLGYVETWNNWATLEGTPNNFPAKIISMKFPIE